ncbi:hypothetical protein HPB49_005682 [Dermacentor silvarum]|uniref:Uncharacterized protein n=1 Tax=Dermacentor silvarum TaxID=543639 RepID=A0ACB8DV40_DERSI|nr:hypothetical protein HPB49_005682 [Dermacentor silvarum]
MSMVTASARLDSDQAPCRLQASPCPPRLRGPPAITTNSNPTAMAYEVKGQDYRLDYRGPTPVTKGRKYERNHLNSEKLRDQSKQDAPLPQDDIKIVIRIRGGINIAKVGQLTVTKAIAWLLASNLTSEARTRYAPNLKQNIMVVSTPSEANAAKYLRIRNISIEPNV